MFVLAIVGGETAEEKKEWWMGRTDKILCGVVEPPIIGLLDRGHNVSLTDRWTHIGNPENEVMLGL
jgi:hypothetical protein